MTATRSITRSPQEGTLADEPVRRPAARDFAAVLAQAQADEREGRRAAARAGYEEALRAMRTADDGAQASTVLRWIARTWHADGQHDAALECLEAALALAERWGDHTAAGHAVNVQAVVRWHLGDLDDAERLCLVARQHALRAGDAKLAAITAQNLGVLANIRGDWEVAERHYSASLAEYRALGLTREVSHLLNNVGLLHAARQRWPEAERAYLEAVQICELAGDVATRTAVDLNLADLWVARGEYARAQGAVRQALAAAAHTGDASAIGKGTMLLGVIAREAGDLEEAERQFVRADEVATARQEVLLQAEIARERADLARRLGKNRDVLQQLNRSHRLFQQLRARPDLADIHDRVGRLEAEFLHVARRWGESIEAKDRYTQGHCQRVADLACRIAERAGLDAQALFWFRIGALLHDVGKLVIPPEVLNKPGKLDDAEWALMKSHTTAGVQMLADIEFPWDVRPLIESHHERWDGKGYPHGLAGEQIPLVARILCVADVYDALTSVRSYKRALSHDETMAILRKDVGTMFDPQVFAWFEEVAPAWSLQLARQRGEEAAGMSSSAATGSSAAGAPTPDTAPNGPPNGASDGPPNGAPAAETSAAPAPAVPVDLDDLTAMPTRRAFRETAERLLAARRTTERPVSLLVVDVDHFKLVNDVFGHLQGDAVLRLVADQLRVNTRPSDYLARYAGDEFVVLLPGTRLDDACQVAERVRQAVAGAACPRLDGAGEVRVTLSIGVAAAPQHGESLETLFAAADAALYGAKREGRDAVTPAGSVGGGRAEVLLEAFVGRQAERTRLHRLLDEAAAGRPQVVAVTGEAGVGKSTLLGQLAPDVSIRAGALVVGHCLEADVRPPYGPWSDVVRSAHRAGLVAPRRWRELPRLVPELGEPPAGASSQHALLEELEEFLGLATAARPLVVILDDMQWADAASWDALDHVMLRLREQRLLLCLVFRADDEAEGAAERRRRLSRSERFTEVPLARLGRDDLAQWLRAALGGQEPDAALLGFVAEQSEGNPLFAVQTLRTLVDEGALRMDGGRWRFVLPAPSATAALPRAIDDLLARRLARLGPARREVLAVASVLGREFDPDALVTACERPEAEVDDALDAALAAGVLAPSPLAPTLLAFTHALLVRALQRGINPRRIRRIHERVARALEAGREHDPAALAVHFDRAGCPDDARRTALDAAERARRVYAVESAAEFLALAARHATTPTEQAEVAWRQAQVAEERGRYREAEEHVARLLDALAEGTARLGALAAVRRMRARLRLQLGVPTAEVLGECDALLDAARAADDVGEVVALLVMLAGAHMRLGDERASERLAREAVARAEALGDGALLAEAVMRLGSTLVHSRPADAVPQYRRALDGFTQLGLRVWELKCQINIGLACDRAGNHPAAEVSYVTALSLAREIHRPDLVGAASLNLGVVLLRTGRLAEARERLEDARRVYGELGHAPHRLATLFNLAHLARAESDPAAAMELYASCAAEAAEMEHFDVHVGAVAGMGLAALDQHATAAALAQYARAQALVAGREARWFAGRELWESLRVRVALTRPALGDAGALLVDAHARAEAFEAHAGLWLAAECRDALAAGGPALVALRERCLVHARALGYAPLVAALREPAGAVSAAHDAAA